MTIPRPVRSKRRIMFVASITGTLVEGSVPFCGRNIACHDQQLHQTHSELHQKLFKFTSGTTSANVVAPPPGLNLLSLLTPRSNIAWRKFGNMRALAMSWAGSPCSWGLGPWRVRRTGSLRELSFKTASASHGVRSAVDRSGLFLQHAVTLVIDESQHSHGLRLL